MLSNAYLLAKFRFDTAENERNFAEMWPRDTRAGAPCPPPPSPWPAASRPGPRLPAAGSPPVYSNLKEEVLPNFWQTLRSLFSAVSRPILQVNARVKALDEIQQDLHFFQFFASFHSNCTAPNSTILLNFAKHFRS